MARYIDADALKEAIKYYHSHTGDQSTNAEHYAYGVVLKYIDRTPTANVVEVVRCKDCKYWTTKNDGYCSNMGALVLVGDKNSNFCGYGERKDAK